MKNSYTTLPEGYKEIEIIDLKKNKKQFWLVNIGSLLLAVPLIIPMFFFKYFITFGDLDSLLIILFSLVTMILTLVVHELIHGLFFKIFGKGKLKFGFHGFAVSCCMLNVYFSKPAYLVIGMSPFVILNAVFAALSGIFYNTEFFLVFYISLIFNFSGCIGDLFVSYKLLRKPKTTLVTDGGTNMKFYDLNIEA